MVGSRNNSAASRRSVVTSRMSCAARASTRSSSKRCSVARRLSLPSNKARSSPGMAALSRSTSRRWAASHSVRVMRSLPTRATGSEASRKRVYPSMPKKTNEGMINNMSSAISTFMLLRKTSNMACARGLGGGC
jgi:hypothetical protein